MFVKTDHGEDTDEWALEHGYVAIVPVHFDFTASKELRMIKSWF
jgi:5'-nucleotidase